MILSLWLQLIYYYENCRFDLQKELAQWLNFILWTLIELNEVLDLSWDCGKMDQAEKCWCQKYLRRSVENAEVKFGPKYFDLGYP